jgi:hypothetical protein
MTIPLAFYHTDPLTANIRGLNPASSVDCFRLNAYHAFGGAEVNTVTIRIEMRLTQEMNEYLLSESNMKKLSFEALLISYIEERMNQDRQKLERTHAR